MRLYLPGCTQNSLEVGLMLEKLGSEFPRRTCLDSQQLSRQTDNFLSKQKGKNSAHELGLHGSYRQG